MKPFDPRLLRVVPAVRAPLIALAAIGVASGVATIGLAFALTALVVAVATGAALGGPVAWVGGIFAVRAVLGYATERVAAWAGVVTSTSLRAALTARLGTLTEEERPEAAKTLALVTSGCTAIEPYAARFLPTLVAAAVVPVLAVGALLWQDPWSALIVILTLPLLPLFAALIGKTTAEQTDKRWAALAALAGHFLDVMRGLPTLVSYGRAKRQVETIREVSDRHRRATMSTLRLAFLSTAALELLATISVAIVAVSVGIRLANGDMPLGVAMVSILLAPEAYWPIRKVGTEFHSAADGTQALAELLDVIDRPEGGARMSAAASTASSPVVARLTADRLTYRHPGSDQDSLAEVTTEFPVGLTVVTGPSGAGKSTLLEILAGLRTPTGGSVTLGPAHLVSQRAFLAAGSVRAALEMGNDAADDRLWDALRAVGMDGVIAALPAGLSADLGDEGFGLSAGQRQRLALARAWLAPEGILLLDEPTAHLDDASAAQANQLIADLAERRIIVAVTHRPELSAYANHHLALLPPATSSRQPSPASPPTKVPDVPASVPGRMIAASEPPVTPGGNPDLPGDPQQPRAARSVWRPVPGTLSAGFIGGIATAAGMALTATSGWLIVKASERPIILTLLAAIVLVRTFGIARPVFRYWERLRSHDAALRDLADRRAETYAALIPLTPARLGRRRRSDVLTGVVDDLTDVVEAQVRVTVPVVSFLVTAVLAIALVTTVSPTVGLIIALLIAAIAAVGALALHLERGSLTELLNARAEVNRTAELICGQTLDVRAVGGWPAAMRWVAEAQSTLRTATRRQARGRAFASGAFLICVAIAVAATAAVAAGTDTSGPLKALLVLTPVALADAITPLTDAMRALARAEGSEARLTAIVQQTPAVKELLDPATDATDETDVSDTALLHPDLIADKLAASWTGEHLDLPPTNLTIRPGQSVALVGPNGCGKSTLLAVLARQLDPASGDYLFAGAPATAQPLETVRGAIAFVDAETHVFGTSLRENLRLARPEASDDELIAALTRAGLGSWYAALPAALDTALGSTGRGVSGGERARLGLARAHVSERPVLLLDEPVAHLDPPTAAAVLADLFRATQGVAKSTVLPQNTHINPPYSGQTIVMATHRQEGLELFNWSHTFAPSAARRSVSTGGSHVH